MVVDVEQGKPIEQAFLALRVVSFAACILIGERWRPHPEAAGRSGTTPQRPVAKSVMHG
jgi:hypothetical protein